MTDGHGRCIKRFVRIARKSAKFPLSPAETVQFTAKIATQSEKIAVVKRDAGRYKKCPVSNPKGIDLPNSFLRKGLRVRKIGSVKPQSSRF